MVSMAGNSPLCLRALRVPMSKISLPITAAMVNVNTSRLVLKECKQVAATPMKYAGILYYSDNPQEGTTQSKQVRSVDNTAMQVFSNILQ